MGNIVNGDMGGGMGIQGIIGLGKMLFGIPPVPTGGGSPPPEGESNPGSTNTPALGEGYGASILNAPSFVSSAQAMTKRLQNPQIYGGGQ